MKIPGWLLGGLGLVAVAIALFAAPTRFEGPILVPISPGHALSVLDSIALVPLIVGAALLCGGLWQRRWRLIEALHRSPGIGSAGIFVAGLGLGLLLASAFSSFFWWWVIGAGLFLAMAIAALIVAVRG
jgi:hypothetical protein